jgi:hypothetical protein
MTGKSVDSVHAYSVQDYEYREGGGVGSKTT